MGENGSSTAMEAAFASAGYEATPAKLARIALECAGAEPFSQWRAALLFLETIKHDPALVAQAFSSVADRALTKALPRNFQWSQRPLSAQELAYRARAQAKAETARLERQAKYDAEMAPLFERGRKIQAELERAFQFYDQFRLKDGTHILDATRDQLLEEANYLRNKADAYVRSARFLERLSDECRGNKTVRECVPDATRAAIYEAAFSALPRR